MWTSGVARVMALTEHDDAAGCGLLHALWRVCPGLLRCDRKRQCGVVPQTLLLVSLCVGIGAAADGGANGEREAGARAPASPDPFYARQRAAPRGVPAWLDALRLLI